jgi:hypothetical protein
VHDRDPPIELARSNWFCTPVSLQFSRPNSSTTSATVFWNSRYSVSDLALPVGGDRVLAHRERVQVDDGVEVLATMAAAVPNAPSSRYMDDSTR